jgi:hypothetical protein
VVLYVGTDVLDEGLTLKMEVAGFEETLVPIFQRA